MFASGKSDCCFLMKWTVYSQALGPAKEGESLVRCVMCVTSRGSKWACRNMPTYRRPCDYSKYPHSLKTYQALSSHFISDQEPGHKVRRYRKPLVLRGKGKG